MMVKVSTLARVAIVNFASPMKMHSLTIFFIVVLFNFGRANDVLPAASGDQAILLHGGTLHPISAESITDGKLLMDRGRIVAIGRADEILDGEEAALKVSCSGSHVYPGLISANGTLGLVEISAVRATVDLREPGMINPSVRAESAVNPDSELLPVARANGILITLTVPQSGGLLSGRSALLQLDGWTWEDMVVKAPVGMHLYWPRMRYGSSASADAQKSQRENWEERLKKLQTFFEEARAYQKAKLNRDVAFRSDVRLDAMMPVLEKRLRLFVHALGVVEIQRALQFVEEQDLEVVLVSGQDVARVTALLKAREIPVVLSTVQALPLRRWEPYDAASRVPAALLAAGVPFCIANGSGNSSGASNARNLPYIAAAAVGEGFTADDALRSITLSPAEVLGVADQLGSLQVGKLATLMITDGNPLEIPTNVQRAFVRGREIDLSSRHTQFYEKYQEKQRRMLKPSETP